MTLNICPLILLKLDRLSTRREPYHAHAIRSGSLVSERHVLVQRADDTPLDPLSGPPHRPCPPRSRILSRRPDIPPRMGGRPIFAPDITFEDFATKWTSGELHRLFPKRIRAKRTADQDAWMLRRWVFPRLGPLPLAAITYDDCEDVLDGIPETRSVFVVRQVAQAIARVLRLAVHPGRVLKDCPVPRGFVPPILKQRARTYLFPEEDRRLLACPKIALIKRLLYGVFSIAKDSGSKRRSPSTSRISMRRTARSTWTGTRRTIQRAWGAPPKRRRRASSLASPLPPKPGAECAPLCPPAHEPPRREAPPIATSVRANIFREELEKGGCARSQLFENNEDRRWICLHDLSGQRS